MRIGLSRHGRPDRDPSEAGAAAVELALLLPLLVVIVFGIIEFGLAYTRAQSFNAAAREAGRLLAVGYGEEDATAVARGEIARPSIPPTSTSMSPFRVPMNRRSVTRTSSRSRWF